jgi:hypothetical protein
VFSAPDESIKGPLQQYYELGLMDVKIAELLKEHYDVDEYGLRYVRPWTLLNSCNWLGSIFTVSLRFKGYENSGACSRPVNKKHMPESIYNKVYEICKHFPLHGIEGICKSLWIEHDIHASQ